MMWYQNHLYVILFPNTALVGSQLGPEDFGRHFISGSSKYYAGKLIFAEVDPSYRHPYFHLEEVFAELVPHEDGRPKSTKYVSTYRVLEHIDYSALQNLFITTPEGFTLALASQTYDEAHQNPGLIRVYAEISPVSMMVLSTHNFEEYGQFITHPQTLVGAPQMFFTQIGLDIEVFLKEHEANPLLPSPLPDIHPAVLRNSIIELRKYKEKQTKGLSLASSLGKIGFKHIRHGFLFASQKSNKFYPMPALDQIEATNYRFWKSM